MTPLLRAHCPPELVVFDVDGTLHDTFQWWTRVIRAGLERFAAKTGIELAEPSDEAACAVVGMKDAGVWAPFLPEGEKHLWPDLRATVLPMEVEEISSGRDYLFPGVRELLPHLREIGVKVALASNCRSEYMEAVQLGQGLRALSDLQLCLDSDGVETKTDMLALAAGATGARRRVMVGDREPDRDAARELGWPFVWRANDRCRMESDSDAVWGGEIGELLRLLGLPGIS